jgi:phospholipase C
MKFLLFTMLISLAPLTVAQKPSTATPIQQVVFLMLENHTYDSMCPAFPASDCASTGMVSNGQTVHLSRALDPPVNWTHSWQSFKVAENHGLMNKFDTTVPCANYGCYAQYQRADIPNFSAYARTFAVSDNFFSSLNGPSYPNHQYWIAGQSGGAVNVPNHGWLCSNDQNSLVQTWDPSTKKYGFVAPCMDYLTMGDVLDAANVTWHYYAAPEKSAGSIWSAYGSIAHCRNSPTCWAKTVNQRSFEADALAGNLAAVNWVVFDWNESCHPSASLIACENRTVSALNAVMNGPQWTTTAVFITWDDGGGWYDHVMPPQLDAYGAGLRVPLLAISPFIVPQVYHELATFDSFLKFVEVNWNVPSLTARDAAANSLVDMFNFSQKPLPRLVLSQRSLHLSPAQRRRIARQAADEHEAETGDND